jgi:ACS family hexuronate transporter-like MFS transporter
MISADSPSTVAAGRSETWKWYVCILLLMATVVNYMDRLTVNTLAVEIRQDFDLDEEEYGHLELGFGLAFATGSLVFGALVDRVGVFWIYPVALIGWSMMGFFTGLSRTYSELLLLRIGLGLFEAGHFPCGLKTVQLLMAPRDRAMGNSLLQSGTAIGAVLAPQLIRALMDKTGDWRLPFLVIGAGGCAWVVFWLASVRPRDLQSGVRYSTPMREAFASAEVPGASADRTAPRVASFWEVICTQRFLGLMVMVICINLNWHLFRVWLPLFLRESRGYTRDEMLNFITFYYMASDLGVMCAGAASSWLVRRGSGVFGSRMWAFGFCALLTTTTTIAALLPKGPLLMASLLLVAFGGLGCFATYYSLTQDLSRRHQGKVSGLLATSTWLVTAAFHPIFGRYLVRTHNYDLVVGAMGWLPMIALVAVLILWRNRPAETPAEAAPEPPPEPAEPLPAGKA